MFALYFEFTFWFVFQKNCRDLWLSIIFSLTSLVSFGSLTALYLIYLLLFNFQGPSCLPLAWGFLLSCATHILYHILRRLSRGFAKVFKVFSRFCFTEPDACFFSFTRSDSLSLVLASSLDATFILYHIFLSLSRGFAKVFWVFFVNLSGSVSWPSRFCISRSQL